MPAQRPVTSSEPEIPFKQEVFRKATHMGALVIPGGYWILGLSKGTMLAIMIPIAVAVILIDVSRLRLWRIWRNFFGRVFGAMIRNHEEGGDFSGATYILISVCLTVALFDRAVAVAALSFIIVGDTFAAIIGRKFGRHKFGRKSVEGSLACLVGTLIVGFLAPGISWQVGVIGAVVATVVEAISRDIDDNVSVPLMSGVAMTVFAKIVSNL